MKAAPPLLLVSVRNVAEALAALEGGADIIDVKEPSRGSLGAADRDTMREIADAVVGKRRLSAAMGELAERDEQSELTTVSGFTWLKLGLAGYGVAKDLWNHWTRLQSQIDEKRELVAAAYADHQAARALPPSQLARALRTRYGIFLLDTHVKDGRTVFDHILDDELSVLAREVRATNASFALAGSLQLQCVQKIARLAPDIVGIRGAACDGGRMGQVRAEKVAEFREALHRADNANRG